MSSVKWTLKHLTNKQNNGSCPLPCSNMFHKVGAGDVSLEDNIEIMKVNIVEISLKYFQITLLNNQCIAEGTFYSEYFLRIFGMNFSLT